MLAIVGIGGILMVPLIDLIFQELKLKQAVLSGWAIAWMPGAVFAALHVNSFLCPHCGYRFYEAHTVWRRPSRCARCNAPRNRSATLGSGKPLFPRRLLSPGLALISATRVGTGFAELTYSVLKDRH